MPCTVAVVLNVHSLPSFSFSFWFYFKECVSELSEASLCCHLDTGIFGDKVLNKNIYSGKKKEMERKQ